MRADVLFDMRVGDDAKLNLSKMLYIPVKDKCDFRNVSGANTLVRWEAARVSVQSYLLLLIPWHMRHTIFLNFFSLCACASAELLNQWLCLPIPTVFGFCVRVPKALSPRHCAASWTKQSTRQQRLYPSQGALGVPWGHPEVAHEGSLGHVPRTSQHALSISEAVSVQFCFSFSVLLVNFLDSYLMGCCMLHVCGWHWRKPCIEWAGFFIARYYSADTSLLKKGVDFK